MKVAWLFPGQGSQQVGMGKEVFAASAAARDVFARADAALGEPLSALCFEGPIEPLTLTANAQPALVATSAALVAALGERVPGLSRPALAAGHSLGEYSALCASGALSLEDAIRLCRLRGQAQQAAVPLGEGTMAAVMGLSPEALREVCADAAEDQVVAPANFNAPGQTVIAGHTAAVARAAKRVSDRGGKAVALNVSAPFHCALMRPAADRLSLELSRTDIRPLRFPVIANVDGLPNSDPGRVRELLVRQVDGPVQWVRTVERIAAEGVTLALEIGPGGVLAGLVRRIARQITVIGVGDIEGIERARKALVA